MSIRIGLSTPNEAATSADSFWQWVKLCEDGGIDSLWQSDRLISKDNILESMTTMAALAGATSRIKFGMNAVSVTFRDPLVLAKQCANIDFLSGGRLLPVFGIGADVSPEWHATGRDTKDRGRRANEVIAIISRLWSEDSVDFDGEFYHYKDATIMPKPIQQPLPLWIGGNSEAAIQRTAKYGTGWQGAFATPEKIGEVVKGIKAALKVTGRKIDDDHYGTTMPFRFGSIEDKPVQKFMDRVRARRSSFDPNKSFAIGDPQDVIDGFKRYVDQGISKFVAFPMATDWDDLVVQTNRLCEAVLPKVETPRTKRS